MVGVGACLCGTAQQSADEHVYVLISREANQSVTDIDKPVRGVFFKHREHHGFKMESLILYIYRHNATLRVLLFCIIICCIIM